MSERVELGDADLDARWLGVRRHQLVLVLGGLCLVGDGVLRPGAAWPEWAVGAVVAATATPTLDGPTLGEWVAIAARFALRSRWWRVPPGGPSRRGYVLAHRGRLDLSGADVEVARGLADHLDALALAGGDRRVSLHVHGAATVLVQSADVAPPPGWVDVQGTAPSSEGAGPPAGTLLERWGYVRELGGVVAVLRVRDFTAVPAGRAALERVQLAGPGVTTSIHFEVVGGSRARRVAERAVHRVRSDTAASAVVGFRRTARHERSLERLRQREALVAAGRALARAAVHVRVRAASLDELDGRVARVARVARESGLRCELGRGRQGPWLLDAGLGGGR